jgi:hypothetical protein
MPYQPEIAPRFRESSGRLKISAAENIYDADFEYGTQPLRWENFLSGSATVTALPGLGGVQMTVAAAGDVAVRQSRPYHRYQPGKTMYVASNANFGGAADGQTQRVGIFDDGNGIFFEQAGSTATNPYGMFVVARSDSQGTAGGMPVDYRVGADQWNGDKQIISTLDWTRVQMIWMDYAWYGAGVLRWGVLISGEPIILHQIGVGNTTLITGSGQQLPWSRTGNLPVRYEMRNTTSTLTTNFRHFGVSVLIDGGVDQQRGFTYSYGMSPASPRRLVSAGSVRYPVMSFRMRNMGQVSQNQQATNGAVVSGTTTNLTASAGAFTASAYVGRMLSYSPTIGTSVSSATMQTATITASFVTTGTVLTVTAATGLIYPGAVLTGGTATANTIVIGQLTSTASGGALGGVGTYLCSISNAAAATATGTSGGVCRIVFSANHNLNGTDVAVLSGFTTAVNGQFPVQTVVNVTTVDVRMGYGFNPGAITVGSGVVRVTYTARISANTTSALTIQDVVTGGALANPPTASCPYQIGLIDRGQLIPNLLVVSSDQVCVIEIIASTPTAQVGLVGADFQQCSALGLTYSFAERDISATSLSGGEVVYAFTAPAGGSGLLQIPLETLFSILTNIKGNIPDVLTVAVTVATGGTAPNVGVNVVCQEAMS